MKKKLLPLAMLAGLAGAAGTAQAVHLSSDGLGQVLIYPYYTAEAGNDTYITIVNTTADVKAVKVRFLEGENSQEVLDFNLYLSAYDHWSGAITAAEVTDPVSGNVEPGAKLVTGDTSCTAPQIAAGGVPFRNYAYAYVNDPDNPGFQMESNDADRSHQRTREGYIEIIEMGILGTELADGSVEEAIGGGDGEFGAAAAVTHVNGVPSNCALVQKAWDPSGQWRAAGQAFRNVEAPTGGLYGYGVVINPLEGTSAAYDAVALDNFNDVANNTATGSVLPSLVSSLPYSDVLDGALPVSTDFARPIDAVSSVFMRDTLSNDYILDAGLNAETSWVVTFPTKRFYSGEPVLVDRAPFSALWDGATACEFIDLTYWDREEGTPTPEEVEEAGSDFSPLPPQFPTDPQPGFNLCTEVSIINFPGSDVLGSTRLAVGLPMVEGYENGWAKINFANAVPPGGDVTDFNDREISGDDADAGTNVFVGLPVVGFAIQKYQNGTLEGGNILSNYFSLVNHKYTRDITNN